MCGGSFFERPTKGCTAFATGHIAHALAHHRNDHADHKLQLFLDGEGVRLDCRTVGHVVPDLKDRRGSLAGFKVGDYVPYRATVQPNALTVERKVNIMICVIMTVMGKGVGDGVSGERLATLGRAFEEGASNLSLRIQGSCTQPTA